MARRRTTSESKQTREEMESQEEIRKEQAAGHETVSTTPSSWWEERRRIVQPRPEDQEKHYREEQERYERERWMGVEVGERKDIFQIWADSYSIASRMWEESCINLYKPWIESTGALFDKAAEFSKSATPESYNALYGEWIKTCQNTIGMFYPIPTRKSDREMLEKLRAGAEESKNLFQSWISILDEASAKTRELLQGAPDPKKYRENYDIWMRSYEKMFEEFIAMSTKGTTKEALEAYGGVPSIYLRNFTDISKLWRDSYSLYRLWADSMLRFSEKLVDIYRGEASLKGNA